MKSKIIAFFFIGSAFVIRAADGVAPAVLPTIIPSGIMTMGGAPQVLFKVSANDSSAARTYTLAEGSQQEGIKVVAIDQAAGTITFDNHGTVQKIDLQKAALPAYTPPAPPKPAASSASFISPAPALVASPAVPAARATLPEEPAVTPVAEQDGVGISSGVMVIGKRQSDSGGYQHLNGLMPLNAPVDSGGTGFTVRRMPPTRMGVQPTQPFQPPIISRDTSLPPGMPAPAATVPVTPLVPAPVPVSAPVSPPDSMSGAVSGSAGASSGMIPPNLNSPIPPPSGMSLPSSGDGLAGRQSGSSTTWPKE